MDDETKQLTEEFVRVGAATMMHGKPLEDVLNIATTGLQVIDKIKAVDPPKPSAKTTRKR